MKKLLLISVIFCLAPAVSACQDTEHSIMPIHIVGEEANGIELSVSNFETLVASGQDFAVKFYSPYCSHCEELAPKIEKYQQETKNLIYNMDLSVFEDHEKYLEFANKYRDIIVDDYVPAIRFISKSRLTYDVSSNKLDSYTALKNILDKHFLSSNVSVVSSKTAFDKYIENETTFLIFTYDFSDSDSIKFVSNKLLTSDMEKTKLPVLLLNIKDIKESFPDIKTLYQIEENSFIALIRNGEKEKVGDFHQTNFDLNAFIS